MKRLLLAMAVALLPFAAQADDGLVRKQSDFDVKTTIDRLEGILKKRGIGIVARLDHAANAARVGLTLRPTELLLFGNPKLGTPVMNAAQTAAIDLPMKVVALQDASGKVWLIYTKPGWVAERHGASAAAKQIGMMTGALDKLTDAATKKN